MSNWDKFWELMSEPVFFYYKKEDDKQKEPPVIINIMIKDNTINLDSKELAYQLKKLIGHAKINLIENKNEEIQKI